MNYLNSNMLSTYNLLNNFIYINRKYLNYPKRNKENVFEKMRVVRYEQSDNFKAYVDAIQAKSYENLVAIHNRSSLVFTSDVIKEVCKLPKDAEGLKIRGYLIKNDCQIDSKILLHNSNYLRLASQQNIPLDDMVCVYFA